jgi:hypothetical protein
MSQAGGSAQARYERLSARRREGRTRRLLVNVTIALILAAVAWAWIASAGYTFGPWVAATIVFIGFARALVEPNHVRAWGIGAVGERRTAGELDELADAGYVVLHDRRIRGTRANVDHVVIGPGGVFVVETKRMRGKLRVRGDTVIIGGRRTGMVEEVLREAGAVSSALAEVGAAHVPVQPVLYLQEVDAPLFLGKPAGIPIVLSGRQLRRTIRSAPQVLTDVEAESIVALLDERLAPMVGEPLAVRPGARVATDPRDPVLAACPRCDRGMVLRRNRQGVAFLGCSQFPACRGTRPWREAPRR